MCVGGGGGELSLTGGGGLHQDLATDFNSLFINWLVC